MSKKEETYGIEDFGTRRRTAAATPIDIRSNGRRVSEYAEIPCDKICAFQRKDPHDIVDKNSAKYQALVVSIDERGVYDAIIVRRITDEELLSKGYTYEVLEGHHRLEASKELKKRSILARIYEDCSDDKALDVYRVTNLLRKDTTIRDQAYGWWHYFQMTRYKKVEEIQELITQGKVSESFSVLTESRNTRQLRRYARLHELTEEMLELVEKKIMSVKFGVEISYIDKGKQNDLLDYRANLKSLEKAKQLRALASGEMEGEVWCKESIQKILYPDPLPSEKANKETSDKDFIASLKSYIPKHFHEPEAMLGLIEEALDLYFKEHPEKQTEP